jgi:hypothetical protein
MQIMDKNTHYSSLVKMKGNLSQIYSIPFLSKKRNCIGENLCGNFFFKFEQNLHSIKFDAITAVATFAVLHRVA